MSPVLAALPSTLGRFFLTKHAYERMTTRWHHPQDSLNWEGVG
jgi:hypothetical protein